MPGEGREETHVDVGDRALGPRMATNERRMLLRSTGTTGQ